MQRAVTSDATMPALFSPGSSSPDLSDVPVPIAQLGAGPDGAVVLARRGEQLLELHDLAFGPTSPRWPALEARVRAIGAVSHPSVRAVLSLESNPPRVTLDGDSYPPFGELMEQTGIDVARLYAVVVELGRALAVSHHVGVWHGRLHPFAVWVGPSDRPRIELTQLQTRTPQHASIAKCTPPELADGSKPNASADVYALGAMLQLVATSGGRTAGEQVLALAREAMAPEPEQRISTIDFVRRLTAITGVDGRASSPTMPEPESSIPRPAVGLAIGRYELVRQLGAGAMGEVWEARDTTGGANVAIKLLRSDVADDTELLRRFRKEARVLEKVGSPYIANYIDLNEDRGIHYLVLELVTGGSVGAALKRSGRLPERLALAIVSDACRALAEPHRLGIVHRDLKPDNMMFVRSGLELEDSPPDSQLVKLGDFGIARANEPAEIEGGTRDGTVLGTPEYMSPEQCQGTTATPATDVYALGCCLYALTTGKPPFVVVADNQMGVILAHLRETPKRLDDVLPEVSPQLADLVERLLAKDPKRRPADAAELLADLDHLCGADANNITAHPAPPIVNEKRIQNYSFEWELKSTPEQLWPFVSNTEKMNRATGRGAVRFEIESLSSKPGNTITGKARVAGLSLQWREHPYEWIEGNRHVVLRVFEKGVLRWYVAEVTLERMAGGGTRLRNTIKLEPRGFLARFLSRVEIGVQYKRQLDKVYKRLDKLLSSGARPEIDLIDPEVTLEPGARARIESMGNELMGAGIDPRAVEALQAYLTSSSDQDVARIRPLELAARFGVPEDALIDACLRAAKLGALVMVWDVICPSCRIPSSVVESLAKLEEHARCKTCNIGFDVDFSRAIELVFRASKDLRVVETRTYCMGGPAHFPHVAAQVRLAPGERFALPLSLAPGFYLLRSPQLARAHELRVTPHGGVRRLDLLLGERGEVATLTAGDQLVTILNKEPREILVRVERVGDRAFALTAARVMATSAFRELFPDQQLAPGRLMAITQSTLLVAQLDDSARLFRELGDSKAFPVAARFFDEVGAAAREYGGTLVKTFGGLAIAAFERPASAVEAALGIQAAIDAQVLTSGLLARVAVHRGPMMALTQAGRLDYFGENVELALAASTLAPAGCVAITQPVCQDPGVADRLVTTPDQLGIEQLLSGNAAASWALVVRARRSSAKALAERSQDSTSVLPVTRS